MSEITIGEARFDAMLPAVGKRTEPPEGPGRDGNKPLMRNRNGDESHPPEVIAGNTLLRSGDGSRSVEFAVVCAWCGDWMRGPKDAANVSHGMCAGCAGQWEREAQGLAEKKRPVVFSLPRFLRPAKRIFTDYQLENLLK